MGKLAASWNLHTEVGWSSPAVEVIVKHSIDNYLVLLAALYKCTILTFTYMYENIDKKLFYITFIQFN